MLKFLNKIRRDRKRKRFHALYAVGEHTYGVPTVFDWGEGSSLSIGKYCSISFNVKIFLGGEHRTDWISSFPFSDFFKEAASISGHPHTKGDIKIGSDVWIAYGATILSGVSIGDGAVIGAESIVTKDIPPYAIVGGNPARILRYRFAPEEIKKMLDIRWWDWPSEKVLENVSLLMSSDLTEFLKLHGGQD